MEILKAKFKRGAYPTEDDFSSLIDAIGNNKTSISSETQRATEVENKIIEDFNTFIKSADTSDATINRWKEIENFLSGVTDTETLSGLLEGLKTTLQKNINENTSAITTEKTRAVQAEQTLQDNIKAISMAIGNIASLNSIDKADTLSLLLPSCIYNISNKALLIFENSGSGIGAMKQTLIQGGKVQYRYNIKQGATSMDSTYWGEWQDNSAKTIEWSSSFNMNDYKTQGVYYVSGERAETDDNLPILNTGYISGQLTVLDANNCITQYLKLSNASGSEGKEYIRTYANDSWSMWRELKQTANLGQVTDDQLKGYIDNGHYEGAIVNSLSDMNNMTTIVTGFLQTISSGTERLVSGTLFSMEVLNNYAITSVASSLMGVTVPRSVTQKAKILLINDGHYDGTSYLEVQRTKIGDADFGNWKLVNIL